MTDETTTVPGGGAAGPAADDLPWPPWLENLSDEERIEAIVAAVAACYGGHNGPHDDGSADQHCTASMAEALLAKLLPVSPGDGVSRWTVTRLGLIEALRSVALRIDLAQIPGPAALADAVLVHLPESAGAEPAEHASAGAVRPRTPLEASGNVAEDPELVLGDPGAAAAADLGLTAEDLNDAADLLYEPSDGRLSDLVWTHDVQTRFGQIRSRLRGLADVLSDGPGEYRLQPSALSAWRVTRESARAIAQWVHGAADDGENVRVRVPTEGGPLLAREGDWVIRYGTGSEGGGLFWAVPGPLFESSYASTDVPAPPGDSQMRPATHRPSPNPAPEEAP